MTHSRARQTALALFVDEVQYFGDHELSALIMAMRELQQAQLPLVLLGAGPHRSADVATALNIKITSLGPVRSNLIRKGMIYSPAHGDMAFTVPLFSEFMCRAMPTFP